MQISQVNSNKQSFGAKFTDSFQTIINTRKNAIIFRYSKKSPQYQEFLADIKNLKYFCTEDTIDAKELPNMYSVSITRVNKKTPHPFVLKLLEKGNDLFSNIFNLLVENSTNKKLSKSQLKKIDIDI